MGLCAVGVVAVSVLPRIAFLERTAWAKLGAARYGSVRFIDMPLAASVLRLMFVAWMVVTNSISDAAGNSVPDPKFPVVIYTDIVSGPNRGGENDKGIYLSLFGKNLAHSDVGTTTKVYVGDVEVDNYRFLSVSKGRPDIQQLTVQVGALGNPKEGTALPIKVVVDGKVALDPNQLVFTVNPGNIYFVDNVRGVDTKDILSGGTIDAPFKTVQKGPISLIFSIQPASLIGAWGRVQAGDFIVMRGTGTPYGRQGWDNTFLKTYNKSGSDPGAPPPCVNRNSSGVITATGTCPGRGPITIMGYPGEDVFISAPYTPVNPSQAAISSADTQRIAEGKGHWINIVGLRIEGGNNGGVVSTQKGGSNWRVVNNELTAATAAGNATATGGGVTGNNDPLSPVGPVGGPGTLILGNNIHDIYNGPDNGTSHLENHGVYLYGLGTYEIAYNQFRKIRGGSAISLFANGSNNDKFIDNVNIHHNIIQDVGKHGINLSSGSRNNIAIWNNVIYNIDQAGIAFQTGHANNIRVYNNTVYNVSLRAGFAGVYGALRNSGNLSSASSVDIRNNIFVPVVGVYTSDGAFAGKGPITNNLWFNGLGTNPATTFSTSSLKTNPQFVSTIIGSENFRLQRLSPAIDAGTDAVSKSLTNDFDIETSRPKGRGIDVGAYEFIR